ncbi:MAG: FIST C-terminal domain-containing protein [Rhodospirillales bacterium]|nr:FIST C-terminal domain-containing protein [Alphaproteobacteria bacterium]MCB1839945.1 FIST C-terminal domain-containing protein [Alphaproteobacteria bacterium]MCB9977542.1 FIST C-terminal domain-containing protein [Rhodospirillales bacterium]
MSVFTSKNFASAAASGADWRDASKAVLEQLESIRTEQDGFNFGFLYISDMLADFAPSILNLFRSVTRIDHWVGSVGMGVIGSGQAFVNQPAISALIGRFPDDEFCVFPDTQDESHDPFSEEAVPLSQASVKNWLSTHTPMLVCVHADPMADDDPMAVLAELESLSSGFIVGGLTSSRSYHYQFANTVCENAVSGVFFSDKIPVATSISQGCQPISEFHTITKASGTTVYELNEVNALRMLIQDLKSHGTDLTTPLPLPNLNEMASSDDVPEELLPLFSGHVHVALSISQSDQKDYLVRNIMGIDPGEESVIISQTVSTGDSLLFVRRTDETVLDDLSKSLGALKQRIESEHGRFEPKAGLFISCIARGFSETSETAQREMDLVRSAVGDIPLSGFYAGGEISNARLYGYTGLLILFL